VEGFSGVFELALLLGPTEERQRQDAGVAESVKDLEDELRRGLRRNGGERGVDGETNRGSWIGFCRLLRRRGLVEVGPCGRQTCGFLKAHWGFGWVWSDGGRKLKVEGMLMNILGGKGGWGW